MKEYVYKLVHKYVKHPELLEQFGFQLYKDEETGELVIAKPLILPFDCGIVQNTKRLFERFYKDADETEKEDFKDYQFNEDGTVVVSDELRKEWTECQLCFYPEGIGKNQLFINAPDHNQYFNKLVLEKCAERDVNELLKAKVIYKAKVK